CAPSALASTPGRAAISTRPGATAEGSRATAAGDRAAVARGAATATTAIVATVAIVVLPARMPGLAPLQPLEGIVGSPGCGAYSQDVPFVGIQRTSPVRIAMIRPVSRPEQGSFAVPARSRRRGARSRPAARAR